LIVAALAAGAASGVGATASQVVKDAYAGLKALVLRKVGGTEVGRVAVEQHAADPETWKTPVAKAITDAGAADDPAVVEAARRVMELVDPAGAAAGKYVVNITASGERSVAAQTITGNVATGDTTPGRP
jgi:hypothetical protein